MRRLLACLALLAVAGGALAAPRSFTLGHHGTIALLVPDSWTADVRGSTNPESFAILMTPKSGPSFEILVNIPFPPTASAKLPDAAAMRKEVSAAAQEAARQSVEHSLPLQELTGPAVSGFYFRATDRAPLPGEFKYMAQGMARSGGLVLAFTILTNDGQDDVAETALEMLRTGVHHPEAAPGTAATEPRP